MSHHSALGATEPRPRVAPPHLREGGEANIRPVLPSATRPRGRRTDSRFPRTPRRVDGGGGQGADTVAGGPSHICRQILNKKTKGRGGRGRGGQGRREVHKKHKRSEGVLGQNKANRKPRRHARGWGVTQATPCRLPHFEPLACPPPNPQIQREPSAPLLAHLPHQTFRSISVWKREKERTLGSPEPDTDTQRFLERKAPSEMMAHTLEVPVPWEKGSSPAGEGRHVR